MSFYNCDIKNVDVDMPNSFSINLRANSSSTTNFNLQTGQTIYNTIDCGGSGSVNINGELYNFSGSVNNTKVNLYPENIPFSNNNSLTITFTRQNDK